jgi:hypothetical protein
MPELTFDEMTIARALQNSVSYGTAAGVGEAIGSGLLDRIARHEIIVRHGSAPPDLDQLAAMAMQGLLADESGGEGGFFRDLGVMAKRAYDVADAMIAERARRHAVPSPASETTP